jgi:hypothetical protein
MEEFLKSITKQYNLDLIQEYPFTGWTINLPERGNFICELSIGPKATDFYVTLSLDTPNAEQVWTDWMDYYGYENSVEEDKLINDKQCDLQHFIKEWMSSTNIRVKKTKGFLGFFKLTKAEWCHNNNWSEMIICDPYR